MSFIAGAILISAGVAATGATIGALSANKQQKAAEALEAERRVEMDRLKQAYLSIDTSNPYLNMENTMEDLTVNQQQAEFQAQQFQQSQANILDAMRGSAGGSGIASLAQTLAQQGQIASQKSAADIGRQEQANQMAERRAAASIQLKEREGETKSREMQRDQLGTALGMSQAEVAAARQEAQLAEQAKWNAIQGGVEGMGKAATSYYGGSPTNE